MKQEQILNLIIGFIAGTYFMLLIYWTAGLDTVLDQYNNMAVNYSNDLGYIMELEHDLSALINARSWCDDAQDRDLIIQVMK